MKTVQYFVSDDGRYGNTDKSKVNEYENKNKERNEKNKIAKAEYDKLTNEINKLDKLITKSYNKKKELVEKKDKIHFDEDENDTFQNDLELIIKSFPSFQDLWW